MLAKSAIKKFRKRKLESYNWMKDLTHRELMCMVKDLDPVPDLVLRQPMWDHQLVAFLICVHTKCFLPLLDMGLGKTRIILELIAYLKQCDKFHRALIVVPNDVAVESWMMQVEEHRPDLFALPLYGNTQERLELLEDNPRADLCIISYPGLSWMISGLKVIKGRDKRKLTIDKKRLKFIQDQFNFMCLDECTAIMWHTSLITRVCKRVSAPFDYRFGMAGIPTGKDPTALWSQFHWCDGGETLGQTLGIFRGAFFTQKEGYFGGYEYKFRKKYKKLLNRTLQNRSIYYEESECRDVPKINRQVVSLPFTEDMKVYYNKIADKYNDNDYGSEDMLRLSRNSFLNMRRISSGFIGLIDEDTGDKIHIEFPENPKMEAIIQKIEEIPKSSKILIFYQFTWTGDRICSELDKLGISHGRIRGKKKGKKAASPQILRDFVKTKKPRVLVLQNQCGSFALNLQVANYLLVAESTSSPILRGQMEKRLRPALNKKRCFIIDFIMKKNSADESIQKGLKEGIYMKEALLKGKKKLKVRRIK